MNTDWSKSTRSEYQIDLRFDDSESAILWDELTNQPNIMLIPVTRLGRDELRSEAATLHQLYATRPLCVFLHVTVEPEMPSVVVRALRTCCEYVLLHAAAGTPVSETIVEVALSLHAKAVCFAWRPKRMSLAKHLLLRCIGKPSAVPLDTLWLMRSTRNRVEAPEVLIQCVA